MLVDRSQIPVASDQEDVVHHQSNADAPIGGIEHAQEQEVRGRVIVPDEILEVNRCCCPLNQFEPPLQPCLIGGQLKKRGLVLGSFLDGLARNLREVARCGR